MMIYKLFRGPEWQELQRAGTTRGAPIDIEDGYIHFSTASQVAETARRYFQGVDGLMLISVEAEGLGDALKWEPSRGGDLFPHLYRELRLSDVASAVELRRDGEGHAFPDLP